jgi:LysR family transcriptional regulator, hydrogen peroxide-inducible genes activator
MVNRPSIRQLEYAVAVADHRQFRRAAEACAVTQPALSAQIRGLEELLGVQLFERDRRGILLTPEGEAVVARARKVLADLDQMCDAARGSAPLTGPLRLGVIPTVAPYLLPRVLPAVRAAYPQLQLLLREDQTGRLLEQLEAGKLDVLLLALGVEGIREPTMPLYDEPFVVAAPRGHRLLAGDRVAEHELAAERVLLLEDGHCLRDQALSVCRLVGADESADVQATSLGTLAQMVSGGLGVTLLPLLSVEVEAPPEGGAGVRPFAEPQPRRTIGLTWRPTSARAEEFRMLGELIRAQVEPLLTT